MTTHIYTDISSFNEASSNTEKLRDIDKMIKEVDEKKSKKQKEYNEERDGKLKQILVQQMKQLHHRKLELNLRKQTIK
jgi:hypothetical protein